MSTRRSLFIGSLAVLSLATAWHLGTTSGQNPPAGPRAATQSGAAPSGAGAVPATGNAGAGSANAAGQAVRPASAEDAGRPAANAPGAPVSADAVQNAQTARQPAIKR